MPPFTIIMSRHHVSEKLTRSELTGIKVQVNPGTFPAPNPYRIIRIILNHSYPGEEGSIEKWRGGS